MVFTLKRGTTDKEIVELVALLEKEGLKGRPIKGELDTIVAVIGDESKKLEFLQSLTNLPYVSAFNPITSPYKAIARGAHGTNGKDESGRYISKEIRAGPLVVGGKNPLAIMAGPCSIDANDPVLLDEIAAAIKENGAKGLRGGGYKPRSDPYTFRGYEARALELGREVCDKYGLAFVTEPVRSKHIPYVVEYADVLQIGTRNVNQGFYLDVADYTRKKQMPVLAKRGMSQTLETDFLPLVLNIYDNDLGGNPNIMICLRGIQTGRDTTRFTCDAGDVPPLKEKCILPVVGDPSHSAGLERYVVEHAKMYIIGGVDALLVEVHPPHKKPLSDAAQAISYKQLEEIVQFAKYVGRM